MKNMDFSARLHDAVENYYLYNPDTLMPLVLVSLAMHGKLSISEVKDDTKKIFAEIDPKEVVNYDWVRFDPALKKQIRKAVDHQVGCICVEGDLDASLVDIYNTFHHYDTYTVDEEYHHRIGILYHHSSNEFNERAHRQYATICLAEALIDAPAEWLKICFMKIANHMLVKSGLQPERPRLQVALALDALLQYDGEGDIYNPFSGCGIAAAMLEGGEHLWADGNSNDKLFAAARILNYGMGGSNVHFEQHDSTQWRPGKFDYVVNTYMGYIDGKTAFDFCLSKCFECLNENGRFVGMISPKEIFEHQSEELKEAMKRDWLDTIVLLPFGEVAVLINTHKEKIQKKVVRFINMNHPMLSQRPVDKVIRNDRYADYFNLSDVKKKGFFHELLNHELQEREDYEIVRLGDYIQKCKRQTYSLARVPFDERILTYFDTKEKYSTFRRPWMNGLTKRRITSLFAPAYRLEEDCLITNCSGRLEPRLYDADPGPSYFEDGYAFKFNDVRDFSWIIDELKEPYVHHQLHPYGLDDMLPEAFTEEQILNLQLYRPVEADFDADDDDEEDPEEGALPEGYTVHGNNVDYDIFTFLGHGYFGFTYNALAYNRTTGDVDGVVLKEFFPYRFYERDGVHAVLKDEQDQGFIDDNLPKFIEEANIMHKLGSIQNSHIVPATEAFFNEETGTYFYVMPLYEMSLKDMVHAGNEFNEDICLEHILKPICQALYVAHQEGVLHLDIKPDNILLDSEGNAALIDFGVAKRYDEHGYVINAEGSRSTSPFAAPEMLDGNMVKFGPQPDIYGLAATVFYLLTGDLAHPVVEFSDQDEDLREALQNRHCSAQFIDAIVRGLSNSASYRSKDALAFLRLFPGCEKIQF